MPSAVRLIPAGSFGASDGRSEGPWELTESDGRRLVAEMAARQSDRYIDYEHATLHAKATGAMAPAAGWFAALEWRFDGLWAVGVEWTAAAAAHIAAREYRYISPLFSYDTDGRVLQLLGASLTNDPGLDGLTDLAALAAQYLIQRQPPETPMNETLKKLLAALGVAESADEAVALAAVQALKTNVAALSAQVAQPDPARYVPIAALSALQAEHVGLQNKFAALSAQVHTAALEQVIADGLAAGKLTPALEPWARQLGGKDLAALSAYIAAAPAGIVPGATQTGGQSPTGQAGVAALSAEEQKVCSMLGVLPADYLKTKAA